MRTSIRTKGGSLAAAVVIACMSGSGCSADNSDKRGKGDKRDTPIEGDDADASARAGFDSGMHMLPTASEKDAGDAGDASQNGCGDGVKQAGERCDDANNVGGDGCAASCQAIENDFACPDPGMACVSTVRCGDGRVSGDETCDDGTLNSGDGCSAKCALENGYRCPVVGEACVAAACGDGIIAGKEQCEDDNTTPVDSDGCSATCKLEPGFACDASGAACRATVCNDGVKEGSEPCDDGNQVIGDGCNPFCEVEPDCSAGACKSSCGDGLLLGTDTEECDDGNTRSGDGCSATCEIEPGYTCTKSTTDLPDVLEVPVTYRDFISLPTVGNTRHPDFNDALSGTLGTPDLVQGNLGVDGKPVYADNCDTNGGGTCLEGRQLSNLANFTQWYTDVPGVNITLVERLAMQRQPNGSYYFPDASFFPFDGRGFTAGGQENTALANVGGNHNFGFTSEVRYWFEYQGGEVLNFSGDDDVWVFVGGKLVVDLGGLHPQIAGSVTLDATTATNLGLTVGSIYETALFHAERHTDASNFNLTLNGFTSSKSQCEPMCGDGIVAGDEVCDDGTNDGSYGSCTAVCTRGPFCGDGALQKKQEQCDDGVNLTPYAPDGSGCAPGCQKPGRCGDALVDAAFGEQCDDGVNAGGYAECAPDCTLGPRCSDGKVQKTAGEECDDRNLVNNDGCDDQCLLEGPG